MAFLDKYDYSSEDQSELERKLARVRGMPRLDASNLMVRPMINAMNSYVLDESPEARASGRKRS